MATIHFVEKTTATPEQFLAGLTDFGPGRQEIKPRIDPPRGVARVAARLAEAVSPDLRAFLAMTQETVERPIFDGRLDDRAYMTSVYTRHIEQVQATFPAGRLLTFRVADGWAPLCAFLGTPVPEEPFPRDNSSADFARVTGPHFARLVYGPLLRWARLRS